jgi:hypothetical protein
MVFSYLGGLSLSLSRLRQQRSSLGHFSGGRPPAPLLFRLCNTFGISEFSIPLFWGETPQGLPLGLHTGFDIRFYLLGLVGAHSDWSGKFRSGVR